MQDLNRVKNELKESLFEDKFLISTKTIKDIKAGVLEVLKKYTKIKSDDINISIKLSKNLKYLIEINAVVFDIF